MTRRIGLVALVGAIALASCNQRSAREEIRIVGSSTVYPFTTLVAQQFVEKDAARRAPVVESTGTGAGIKQFCEGVGPRTPDILNASRRLKKAEFDQCVANGVGDILEIQIGADGVALAESITGPKIALTVRDVYLALAANPNGRPNTTRTWRDVNPQLPNIPIRVLGPPATSGTRDAFAELIMERGCEAADPTAAALKNGPDPQAFAARCTVVRSDGAYVDSGENDNLIVQKLSTDPNAIGIFGYSYFEENKDRLRGIPLDGVEPTYETIAMQRYSGSRALYIYVKKQHLRAVPGLQDFLNLYATMWNPDGPLVKRGLIAASTNIRFKSEEMIQGGTVLNASELK